MEVRDRVVNLGFLGAAAVAWLAAWSLITTRDPVLDPGAAATGAALLGLAAGLTAVPLFWLAVFSRHGRIAYRGDWTRAIRRGAWVTLLVVLFVALRVQGIFQAPILLFVVAMVLVAETTLSVDR
jgi:hypothetical protein